MREGAGGGKGMPGARRVHMVSVHVNTCQGRPACVEYFHVEAFYRQVGSSLN